MTPVFQTAFGAKYGNCMQAAVASVLNLSINDVPDFGNLKGDPYTRMRVFFEQRGYKLERGRPEPGRYYFATGTSTQGHEHIVVMANGALKHDPNPGGAGLVKTNGYLSFRPMRPIAAADAKPPAQGGDLVLRPVYPNEGTRAWYRAKLVELARRMAEDAEALVRKHYRPASDRIAMDDDPIVLLRRAMRRWAREWQGRFDDMSADIAKSFAGRTRRYTDAQIRKRMKDAGFTVSFKPTPAMISAYRATIAENVNLIQSIPKQFSKDVQSAVWSAVSRGGDMATLSKTVRKNYGVTYRRAALIARTQVMMAKATMERVRRTELGITEAIWQHSHAGKVPRPTHLAMNGKRFKVADGMYDSAEGRKVQPGELINCRCSSRSIIPGRFSK